MPAEAVGELRSKTYDLYTGAKGEDGNTFVGNQEVRGGSFLGGGLGLRATLAFEHGFQLSFEEGYMVGQILGADMPWSSHARADHFTGLFGAGWGFAAGPFRFHTATIIGVDYMGFDVAGPLAPFGVVAPGVDPSAGPFSWNLSRWDLRLGQQVGMHVAVAGIVGLFADGTIDYDGQWRVRAGITIGRVRPRPHCGTCLGMR
jgi:hypothetical protein